ncbi:MAG: efflux RND transporter permease subunit, partial [Dehalococcoidia bacterium]|nr:efflux RND transporter permease subunit [Dehalococcoidia bacterium]
MGLTRFSITRPLALLMLIIGLVVLGVISYQRLRVDRLPNISFPFVSVSVGWPGASPADVEQFIVRPLEAAVAGAPGIVSMTSSATSGRGQVSVQLAEGVDASQAAIDIERRVAAARGRLPSDAQPPVVNRIDPNATPIMNIALAGDLPQDRLLDLATNIVAPRLQSVVGVADVQVFGGQQREVQVQVDLTRLAAYGITLQQIQAALARENINAPAGSLEENNRN